jgi:16S rRNA (guanine(966)-N(2))-methyltransferase RsmD
MRVISGIYKGRKLKSSNNLHIRPTTDQVKEFIFNILQDFPMNKTVVDIFSGSGNLGIEALSRGAQSICFVDNFKQ